MAVATQSLDDRKPVALVTGATGNIGLETCVRLKRDGFHVVACDLSPDPALFPDGCTVAHLDVRSESDIRAAFDVAASFGPLTAVVVSHGILTLSYVDCATLDDLELIADVNLLGVATMCVEAGKRLVPRGSIVTVSSIVARIGRRGNGAFMYAASKAGVESLTRSFAVGLGPKGIRVNAVAPGFLSTPMRGLGATIRAELGDTGDVMSFSPLACVATPGEVSEAIAFLCSSRASGVSGAVLPVDSGQGAW